MLHFIFAVVPTFAAKNKNNRIQQDIDSYCLVLNTMEKNALLVSGTYVGVFKSIFGVHPLSASLAAGARSPDP